MIKNFKDFINERYDDYDVPVVRPVVHSTPDVGAAEKPSRPDDGEVLYGTIGVRKVGADLMLNMKCLTDNPHFVISKMSSESFAGIMSKFEGFDMNTNEFCAKVSVVNRDGRVVIDDILAVYSDIDECEADMFASMKRR